MVTNGSKQISNGKIQVTDENRKNENNTHNKSMKIQLNNNKKGVGTFVFPSKGNPSTLNIQG